MAPGLYLAHLPHGITAQTLKEELIKEFEEIREADELNTLQIQLYKTKISSKMKGSLVATVSGFNLKFGKFFQKAKDFEINGQKIVIKDDNGDERDEFGEFKSKLTPLAKRMYGCLKGEASRKVKFLFKDDFLKMMDPQVYDCQRNAVYAYLNGLPLNNLDEPGTLVGFNVINQMKQFFMVKYSTIVECIQAICLLNGRKTNHGIVQFVSKQDYHPSKLEMKTGLGLQGRMLYVSELETEHGFIPFEDVNQEILRDRSNFQSFCWRCKQTFHLCGFNANLNFIAATCLCAYERALSPMSKERAFFWEDEHFTRLMPAFMDANEIASELIIYHYPMKPSYESPVIYRHIVGPILFEEWKFFSRSFKSTNKITDGSLDKIMFLEEKSTPNGERQNVFIVELVVPKTRFWCLNNRMDIKKLTIHVKVENSRSRKQTEMKKKVKVLKLVEEAESLRMYCRVEFHHSLLLSPQNNVNIVPKPDKTTYSSTIRVLNKIVSDPTEVSALGVFLGTERIMPSVAGITSQVPGMMNMSVHKLKANLNDAQLRGFDVAKYSQISVVQGPPGCGKTYAASVYSILLKATEKGKILACSPSNFAADALAEVIWNNLHQGPCRFRLLRIYSKGLEIIKLSETEKSGSKYTTLHEAVRAHPKWLQGEGGEWDRIRELIATGREHLMMEAEIDLLSQHVKELETETILLYDIIVSTVDSLHDHRVFGSIKEAGITTLIVDEAAQLQQPSFPYLLLFNPKRIIILGDDLQLRPQTASFAAASAGLEVSLMEWFRLSPCEVPWTMLVEQHRMNPRICSLVSDVTYEGRLQNAKSVLSRIDPFVDVLPGLQNSIVFYNHNHFESKNGTSFQNVGESQMILNLIDKLIGGGVDGKDVTVISLYDAQRNLIANSIPNGVNVVNCDGFQGRENKIVILSLTRGNNNGIIGFASSPHRLNVAISRAMHKLFIFGNLKTFRAHKNRVWITFCKKIEDYATIINVQ